MTSSDSPRNEIFRLTTNDNNNGVIVLKVMKTAGPTAKSAKPGRQMKEMKIGLEGIFQDVGK
ncbi:hypothetical protein LOAG_03023 [Loa loa]|uniref:Skp1_POZ domain-containing protein n=1 Tax=Loa loa TaxID=7209 RepID=A0A1I7VWY9_LOALO|nr:hypothetical protein LOAG_03023 [Loa loa]EFO25464.1 hypothetical protein LOAG_03023 [Loa loa]